MHMSQDTCSRHLGLPHGYTHASGPKGKCFSSPINPARHPAGRRRAPVPLNDSRHPDLDGHHTATTFADRKWKTKEENAGTADDGALSAIWPARDAPNVSPPGDPVPGTAPTSP